MAEVQVSAHLQRNYQDYYEHGDSEWRWLGAIDKAANILSLCTKYPHDSILEIGAGEGSILKRLSEAKFGSELFALEISPTGVETIKKKNISRLNECSLFDGYNVPYDDEKFDLVVLSHVIEHVEYPRKLLYEAKRVAKYVFVEVPLEDTVRLSENFILDKVGHINFFSPKTIRRLIQSCNLDVLEQRVKNASKSVYTFQKGRKGLINYYIKEHLLRVLPGIATCVFTYHSALICQDCSGR
ncbi:MAG: class I SAM-dependent methyltransferase [Gammaproteobacteria bacterium]